MTTTSTSISWLGSLAHLLVHSVAHLFSSLVIKSQEIIHPLVGRNAYLLIDGVADGLVHGVADFLVHCAALLLVHCLALRGGRF